MIERSKYKYSIGKEVAAMDSGFFTKSGELNLELIDKIIDSRDNGAMDSKLHEIYKKYLKEAVRKSAPLCVMTFNLT